MIRTRSRELLGFVHVVRGQQDREALAFELRAARPRSWWRTWGSRPVVGSSRMSKLRAVQQRASDHQPTHHAAGKRAETCCRALELRASQSSNSAMRRRAVAVVQAAVERVDFSRRFGRIQLFVEVVLLEHDADACALICLRCSASESAPEDAKVAGRLGDGAVDHAHQRRLARAIRPEKSHALVRRDVEIHPGTATNSPNCFFTPRAETTALLTGVLPGASTAWRAFAAALTSAGGTLLSASGITLRIIAAGAPPQNAGVACVASDC